MAAAAAAKLSPTLATLRRALPLARLLASRLRPLFGRGGSSCDVAVLVVGTCLALPPTTNCFLWSFRRRGLRSFRTRCRRTHTRRSFRDCLRLRCPLLIRVAPRRFKRARNEALGRIGIYSERCFFASIITFCLAFGKLSNLKQRTRIHAKQEGQQDMSLKSSSPNQPSPSQTTCPHCSRTQSSPCQRIS